MTKNYTLKNKETQEVIIQQTEVKEQTLTPRKIENQLDLFNRQLRRKI